MFSACNKVEPEVYNDFSTGILGVWWWDDDLGDEYLDFAQRNRVTEIYYCSSKFNDGTDEFIKKAADRDMDVYWLAGEKEWVDKPDYQASMHSQIAKYLNYQDSHANKFKGIHFDIEPQQYDEFKKSEQKRAELLTQLAELTYSLKEQYPSVWIEYDIPFWIEDEITANGITKPCYQHIIDNASRVTMMSYRDTAQKVYSVASAEIDYAKKCGKRLNLGVITKSSEGDQVSFMEEGKKAMYEEIAKIRELVPEDFGVVIHQIKHWYDLKN